MCVCVCVCVLTLCDPRGTSVHATAKSLQSCPTLCDPIDGSPPGSPVPGILQARTRVGCHFLLQCMKVSSESEVAQSCPTSRPRGLQPPRLLRPWDFPGKSTGVGCHCLLLCPWASLNKDLWRGWGNIRQICSRLTKFEWFKCTRKWAESET